MSAQPQRTVTVPRPRGQVPEFRFPQPERTPEPKRFEDSLAGRTALIVMAVIGILICGYRLWSLWTTGSAP